MRPLFCGNFEYETRQSDLDRLFSKYGRVQRVDMKSGKLLRKTELPSGLMAEEFFLPSCSSAPFSNGSILHFLHLISHAMPTTDLSSSNCPKLPFYKNDHHLCGERGARHRDGARPMTNQRPTKTLFVINFDPIRTKVHDIERHFEPYGKVLHVRIRRNFAFVQFETQEEATKALEYTHMSKILDRMVSVEYALKDDSERDNSPPRRGYGRRDDSPYGRSRSPVYRRNRPSPDYGRARSPIYDRYGGSSYNRDRSPVYERYRSRSPIRR
ncbi:hypothetical protein IFM89_026416 [Coptis chinensis]|uniref:RRM domain-containing protein n=1 Tax=Coptis chinensis TaxID=261450 RepID=A0A835HPP4_9MAGN|nr:hypothetical protein IFM89_026416 [Coptis chinensis]